MSLAVALYRVGGPRSRASWYEEAEVSLKASRYNYFVQTENGDWLCFNQLTQALAIVPDEQYATMQHLLAMPNSSGLSPAELRMREELCHGGFLIPASMDERRRVFVAMQRERFSDRVLHLILMPTWECNFSCSYCYQKQMAACGYDFRATLSQDLADAWVDYVKRATNGTRCLVVEWYGGEPLLQLGTVISLNMSFRDACYSNGCEFRSYIITNGYLLTREACDRLQRAGVTAVMVTVDGPPSVHDRRRPLVNGQPTFSTVVRNLQVAVKYFDTINIRLNLDQDNATTAPELVAMLAQLGLAAPNVQIVLAATELRGVCEEGLTAVEPSTFHRAALQTMKTAVSLGFSVPNVQRRTALNCSATRWNTLTFTPSGDVYKCPTSAGNPWGADGHFDLRSGKLELSHRVVEWVGWNPLESDSCRECTLLPFCQGGCPYNTIIRKLVSDGGIVPSRTRSLDCREAAERALGRLLLYEYYRKTLVSCQKE